MVQLSATWCSCIAILSVSLVSFGVITLCVASQQVFVVSIYFIIDSVRKLLDTPTYFICQCVCVYFGNTCAAGYRGKNCEENIDDCPGNLCQNGATCVDDINRYSCRCPPTYMGELCEQDVDECGQRPSVCQNGATCTNSIGGFSCICVNGWAGPDCSVNIDDCAGAACFNGATCIDRVGSFYCRCTPGKTGKADQIDTCLFLLEKLD
jgi:hypothetical protein